MSGTGTSGTAEPSVAVEQITGISAGEMRRNFWRGVWRVLKRKPTRLIGAVLMTMFALMAIFGPMFYSDPLPRARDANGEPIEFAPMSWAHPFGTDFQGTDVLSQIIVGSRFVLLTAVITAVVVVLLGAGIGLLSGLRRGVTDTVLMRVVDVLLTIPGFPLLVVLSAAWQFSKPWEMGLVLGVFGCGGLARAVRSQTLSLRERGFIEAARGLGLSTPHIVLRELVPTMAPYISMNLLMALIGGVYAQVGLNFLGVVPYIADNWGVMLNSAVFDHGAMTAPEALPYMLAPLLAILLLTLAIVFVVDALDEIFNPRLREE